uniref:Uncharacterized protein n=1 Tax=Anolis carolinensis TaxID=28377 RepID=A0A803TJ61_ANOCA
LKSNKHKIICLMGGKSYTGPCAGRDCSGGCECLPEKGSRVSTIVLQQKESCFYPNIELQRLH